jgi:protein-ribulosamine 3-kinase
MIELFGGFGESFMAAYRSAWPLDAGYPLRRELYNLYHLLNHVNLFGRAYVARTQRMLATLLAAVGR